MILESAPGADEAPSVGQSEHSVPVQPTTDGRRRPPVPGEAEHWQLRRRIERQLHDGPALRIAALTLHLGLLSQKLPGESQLQHDIDDLQHQLHLVLQDLRDIADQIYPPLLYEAGLAATLRELAARARVPVQVDVPKDRFDPSVEAVAYFVVAELLDTWENIQPDDDASPGASADVGPGQVTPGQVTPGQMTPGQVTPGQVSPGRETAHEVTAIRVTASRPERDLVLDITLATALTTRRGSMAIERIQRLGGMVEILADSAAGTLKVRIPCG